MVSLSKDKDKWEMIFTFVNSVCFSKNKYCLVMNTVRLYSFMFSLFVFIYTLVTIRSSLV